MILEYFHTSFVNFLEKEIENIIDEGSSDLCLSLLVTKVGIVYMK